MSVEGAMEKRKIRLMGLSLPLAVLAVYGWGARAGQPWQPLPGVPESWVPFSADFRVFGPGINTATGRFYRFSDGSTRSETRTLADLAIGIVNVGLGRFYSYSRGTGWVSQPLELPPEGLKPRLPLASEAFERVSEPWEGLEVWRLVDRTGAAFLIAPALNAFTVRREAGQGPSFEFTNIVIGEPQASLLPPMSATVRERDEPMRVGRFPLVHVQ
jgi:hypothetical protein